MADSIIFKKRSGTTDLGKDYEDLNVANIVLKTVLDDSIENFTISSNEASFGNFDDIVFETKADGIYQKYAMQLKHSNDKSKRLNIRELTSISKKGDFSIPKYFQSFKNIKEFSNSHNFILFTNRKFDDWNGKRIQFEKHWFSVIITKVEGDRLISKTDGNCYQFTNLKSTITTLLSEEQREYQSFFENFYLYTNQEHVFQLKENVAKHFKEKFRCTETELSKYQQFISDWSIRDGKKEKLNKPQMKRVIALCVLAPFIEPLTFTTIIDKTKFLRDAISIFDVTLFKKKSTSSVCKLWGDLISKLGDNLEEINKFRFQLNFRFVTDVGDLNDETCTKLLWLMGICPLIVKQSESTYEAIKICRTDKFIVLGQEHIDDELPDHCVFRNLSDLNSESELYKNITTACKYSLQGKEETNLASLIEENKNVQKLILTDDLLEMLKETCSFGGESESLPCPYINRYLTRNILDFKYLKQINPQILVVVDNMQQNDDFKQRLRRFNVVEIEECLRKRVTFDRAISTISVNEDNNNTELSDFNFGSDIYVSEKECSKEKFKAVCEINNTPERYHHFSLTEDGDLEWVQSLSDIDELKPFFTENGSTNEINLYSTKNNLNLIIGKPGMGKTLLMKSLKNHISETFWTVIFSIKDVLALFKHFNKQRFDMNKFEEFVLHVKYAKSTNFEKKVLNLLMQNKKVVYIWDAIDEVLTGDMEILIKIILRLSKENFNQWITCRPHLKRHLEKKLNIFSKEIIKFSDEQQSVYIQKRLAKTDHEQKDILCETEMIKKLIVNNDVLEIPLHIFILTELFSKKPDKYSNLVRDIYNLTELYRYFVDEKFYIYYKIRNKSMPTIYQHREILDEHKRNRLINYQKAALRALVPSVLKDKITDEFEKFLKKIHLTHDPVGIITEVTDENIPRFIYKSFAEYFVATYFAKNHKSIVNFHNIIFNESLKNVRFFFDLLLAKKSPAHIAVLYKSITTLQEYDEELKDWKDVGNRNVLHLACSWGQTYPIFQVQKTNKTYIISNSNENDYSVSMEDPKYIEMLNYLLDKCEVSEKDELFNFTALAYAEKTKCFFTKSLILKKQHKKIAKFCDDLSMASVLYFAAKFGYTDIISLFEAFPFIRIQNDDSTYLHLSVCQENYLLQLLKIDMYRRSVNAVDAYGQAALSRACQQGQDPVVNLLLRCEANVNAASNNRRRPLHYACQSGQLQIVRYLLGWGAYINAQDYKRWTPLHIACYNGHSEIVEFLIEKGADINLQDAEGWTPLRSACINGSNTIIQLLIKAGVDVNFSKEKGWTLLHSACYYGHYKTAKLLLRSSDDVDVNVPTTDGKTPLHYACEKGHGKIVRLLCQYDVDINAADKEEWTPLHLASNNGNHTIVELLIRKGGNINACRDAGWTPLHIASHNGHEKVVEVLIKKKANFEVEAEGRTPLHLASQLGHEEAVKVLLANGCKVDAVDKHGLTPLHWCCIKKQPKIVEILVEHKAEVNLTTRGGKISLHLACEYGHYEIVELLLRLGASVKARDKKGLTPLHLACHKGHQKITQLLVLETDINVTSKNGWTPLHYACQSGHFNIIQVLIESEANINPATNSGWTPLHIACQNGYQKVVRLLLYHKANLNASSNIGRTPLHVACENYHYEIVKLLIDLEADIDSSDDEGVTPLHLTCHHVYFDIVQLLVSSGAKINAATNTGCTPLHLICSNGSSNICQHLLKYENLDLEAVDNERRTPFYLACQNSHENIVYMLMELRVNYSIRADDGSTPLHAACSNGNEKIVYWLVNSMEDINFSDANGCTPLHYACDNGYTRIVKMLLKKSTFNIDAVDNSAWTALHFASAKGYHQVVQVLLDYNANFNAFDKENKTPLIIAREKGHTECVSMLIQARANLEAITRSNQNGYSKDSKLPNRLKMSRCTIIW